MDLKGAMLMSGQTGLMDNYMLLILVVMILMGILGGIANYYMSERQSAGTRNDVLKYSVLGVVAALSVPLFLNMISSNLLDAARAKPADLFVFAGFCLIFVIFSRRVFENVANKLFQQLDQVKQEVGQLKEVNQARDAIQVEEALAEPPTVEPAEIKNDLSRLGYNDVEIMRAITEGNFVYGNVSGIANETSLSKELVSVRLTLLKSMGLIELKINEKNVLHWTLAQKGKQFLGEVMESQEAK
jgi:hypothetical protein